MGQAIIMDVLEKSKIPLSRNQIAERINDTPVNTSKVLRILLKHREIKCIELDRHQTAKLLNWKVPIRRTRFYYIEMEQEDMNQWQE